MIDRFADESKNMKEQKTQTIHGNFLNSKKKEEEIVLQQ